jgi:hypothetical protein
MNRRNFIEGAGITGLVMNGQVTNVDSAKTERVFVFSQYFLKNGTQPTRIHEYFSGPFLSSMKKFHSGPQLFLEALVAARQPQVAVLLGFDSLTQMYSIFGKLYEDKEWRQGLEKWESGEEAPYEECSRSLLMATPYCPPLKNPTEPPQSRKIYEVRVYHSPTQRQLEALHARFAGPEIKIFHRVGVHPILYSSGLFGQNIPNLTYIIPFENLAAREKAWDAFGQDPEWIKVRKESIDRSGQISIHSQVSLYRATAYSPIR